MLSHLLASDREWRFASPPPRKRKLPQQTVATGKASARPLAHTKAKMARASLGQTEAASAKRVEEMVGLAHESDTCHWGWHSCEPGAEMCFRCNFIRHKADITRHEPWCTPRPSFMGGHWRLGCDVCYWYHRARRREKHKGRRGCDIRASACANHSFRHNGTYAKLEKTIKQHATTTGHRVAVVASKALSQRLPARIIEVAESRPLATECLADGRNGEDTAQSTDAAKLVAETASAVVDDRNLLKGRVPQIQDWLDAWAESTEHMAFHKQARILGKKGQHRYNNLRRVRRKQIRVIAEARREDIRKQLGEAQFISVSMDDRKYEKVLRLRCDAPSNHFVRRGILGVLSL